MRATLSFKLPEEQEEFDTVLNAEKVQCALNELDNRLRNVTKHDATWLKEEIQKEMDEGCQDPATAAAYVFRRLLAELSQD